MTINESPMLQQQVEQFLYKEAALLDDWKLNEWLELFTEDARYVVPTTDLPEADPNRDLVFINDDIARLRARVTRLLSQHSHREHPLSRTRRFISNVRLAERQNSELTVFANILVYRFRSGDGAPYVGSIKYVLRMDGQDLKIASRRATLDLEDLAWHGAVSIIF